MGGILLLTPTVWTGSGGDRRDTQEHTGTYTRMLHLPYSDPPLKKCPILANFHKLRVAGNSSLREFSTSTVRGIRGFNLK